MVGVEGVVMSTLMGGIVTLGSPGHQEESPGERERQEGPRRREEVWPEEVRMVASKKKLLRDKVRRCDNN